MSHELKDVLPNHPCFVGSTQPMGVGCMDTQHDPEGPLMSFLSDLVKKPLTEQVEASRKALPATLINLSTQAVAFLPTTVEKATAVFRDTYSGLTVKLAGWIPTTIPALTRLGNRLADWAVVKIKAIK